MKNLSEKYDFKAFIPEFVQFALDELKKNGFQAFIVGGCVRDLFLERKPKDWDICTRAKPEEIQKIFPKNVYDNKFGTVKVFIQGKEIEITPFRKEEKYTDLRHPDKISFSASLEEDLARRDFTINAMAIEIQNVKPSPSLKLRWAKKLRRTSKNQNENVKFKIIDLFEGQKDLKNKIIRAVGSPEKRFSEDALRMLRAVRFACQLDFKIERKTFQSIKRLSRLIKEISSERIRDEIIKIFETKKAAQGISFLKETDLLSFIIPELEKGIGVSQNKHHLFNIFEHLVYTLDYAVRQEYPLEVRIASLFHDLGKPETKKGKGEDATFYNHDAVSALHTQRILQRLKFPKDFIEKVAKLVRWHMFYYNVEEVKEAGVRRLLKRIGKEDIQDLIKLRIADRVGSGCKKPKPYKLRHLEYLIEKVSSDPISLKMLEIKGSDLIKELNLSPGPRIGLLLDSLLSEVLEDPKLNNRKHLLKRAEKLNKFSLEELEEKRQIIREKKEEVDKETRRKFWV